MTDEEKILKLEEKIKKLNSKLTAKDSIIRNMKRQLIRTRDNIDFLIAHEYGDVNKKNRRTTDSGKLLGYRKNGTEKRMMK